MKLNLRFRGCYCPNSKRSLNHKIYTTCLLPVFLFLSMNGNAQAVASSRPAEGLKIGDAIPEALWHLSLQVVNHPEGKDTITLNDYRDKMVILDFWSTWCSACIASIEKLMPLNHVLKEDFVILPVTSQDRSLIAPFISKRNWSVPSVTGNTNLHKAFPHQGIPHLVWLSDNKVQAITGAQDALEKNIRLLLKGADVKDFLVMKKGPVAFDPGKPMLAGLGLPDGTLYSHSIFTGSIDSLPKTLRVEAAVGVVNMINVSAAELIQHAYSDIISPLSVHQRCVWETDDPTRDRLVPPAGLDYREQDAWERRNSLCYGLFLPGSHTPQMLLNAMKEDLHRLLVSKRLMVSVQKRPVSCLVLSRGDKPLVKHSQAIDNLDFRKFFFRLQYAYQSGPLPLVDETGWEGNIAVCADADLNDKQALQATIFRHGLKITESVREMDVLVIATAKEEKL